MVGKTEAEKLLWHWYWYRLNWWENPILKADLISNDQMQGLWFQQVA